MAGRGVKISLVLMSLFCLCLFSLPAFAQDATPTLLRLNENAFGTISNDAPTARYLLASGGAEAIVIEIYGVGSGFAPRFRVFDPTETVILEVANPDGLLIIEGTIFLPDAGAYTIVVDSENDTRGQFILSLQAGEPPPTPVELSPGESLSAVVGGETPVGIYRFSLSQPSLLHIMGESDSGPAVHLYDDASGLALASSNGGALLGVTFHLSASDLLYRVEVRPATTGSSQPYKICVDCEDMPATGTEIDIEPLPPPATASTACSVVSTIGGPANIRSGPSTNFSIIGSLLPGQALAATGQLAGGSWFQVDLNGATGWVGASVARLDGDCASLPVVAAPAGGAAPAPTTAPPPAAPAQPDQPPPPTTENQPTQPPSPTPAPTSTPQPTNPPSGSGASGTSADTLVTSPNITLGNLLKPDLVAIPGGNSIQDGRYVIPVRVHNRGNATAGPSTTRVCYVQSCQDIRTASLSPGASITYFAYFDPVSENYYQIIVDYFVEVDELNESNNIVSGGG